MAQNKLKIAGLAAIAAGSIIGALTAAPALAHEGRYVTVLWSVPEYPNINAPQPFISASDTISVDAFDEYLASPERCGTGWHQVDIYKSKLEDGTSWETLKASGSLEYAHDGAFLAYDLGTTPYKLIEAPECAAPTPTPTDTPTPTSTPTSPTPTPSATTPPPSSSPEPPTSTPTPTSPVTSPPVTTPSPTPSESSSVPPVVVTTPPSPSSSPTQTSSNVPVKKPSPTGTSTPTLASPTSSGPTELAYTGSDGAAQVWRMTIAALLLALGFAALFVPRVIKHYRRRS